MSMLETAKFGVRQVGDGFTRPDDDWRPVLFMKRRDGQIGIAMITLDGEGDKDDVAETMTQLCRQNDVIEAVFAASAWSAKYESEAEMQASHPPSEDPNRQEVLTITHVTSDTCVTQLAPIERDGKAPPRLGEFDTSAEGVDVGGRFADAIRLGLQ